LKKKPRKATFMDNYLQGLEDFNATLTPPIKDPSLLKEVFTHSSFLNEAASSKGAVAARSNERLEFLGDSVLGAAISHLLFDRYPDMPEGGLTRLRARLVNGRLLSGLAKEIGLENHILMGRGMASASGAKNDRVLAGLLEAYLGARYIEEGFAGLYSHVERLFSGLIETAVREPGYFDYKPALQELSQRLLKSMPVYTLAGSTGTPHDRTFTVEVSINGKIRGCGTGKSKKEAEQAAARNALDGLKAEAGNP